MKQKTVAVLFGGQSPEHRVSLASAAAVLGHMEGDRYRPLPVGITRQGEWKLYTGAPDRIADGSWEKEDLPSLWLLPDRRRRGFCLPDPGGRPLPSWIRERIEDRIYLPVDAVFPVLHGLNGEDGTVQGLCELAGLPLAGCGTLASALCMDKERAHALVFAAGIPVPRSVSLEKDGDRSAFAERVAALGYPVFLKPVRAGSSFGVHRVETPDRLADAMEDAFLYDDRILAEEAIDGAEVGCGVVGREDLLPGIPDEIELAGGFFDYTEKYHLVTSRIHNPARVSSPMLQTIQRTALRIYRILGCGGFARVDLFLTREGRLIFNEVNTIPGFTAHSRFPRMMEGAGLPFPRLIDRILEEAR